MNASFRTWVSSRTECGHPDTSAVTGPFSDSPTAEPCASSAS
ncbi:hypothetical protein SCATT_55110 [Streptantibioticus cattleyicolor NRRL 8057 = DSM 46488]|uniref:Uncharacterized protein n=1 Tax=Streptantibioticus cattleyicolor (strain ATCC 35852 / DSM 46488 / JCM 4925 / NBRC 14057 / NRRL 8057) TaxID=1003195 RepID=G8WYB1_STREN|nr:hypothetical protein SCATT_55110 [Streptantibioticus cattleyicolor NRRL 8057 = DSM 46488]